MYILHLTTYKCVCVCVYIFSHWGVICESGVANLCKLPEIAGSSLFKLGRSGICSIGSFPLGPASMAEVITLQCAHRSLANLSMQNPRPQP